MTVKTFRYLLGLVGGKLERIYSFFKKSYKRGEDFRCSLWRLSYGSSYRSISKVFSVGKSTIIIFFSEQHQRIVELASNFIKFPDTFLETAEVAKSFYEFTECNIL